MFNYQWFRDEKFRGRHATRWIALPEGRYLMPIGSVLCFLSLRCYKGTVRFEGLIRTVVRNRQAVARPAFRSYRRFLTAEMYLTPRGDRNGPQTVRWKSGMDCDRPGFERRLLRSRQGRQLPGNHGSCDQSVARVWLR